MVMQDTSIYVDKNQGTLSIFRRIGLIYYDMNELYLIIVILCVSDENSFITCQLPSTPRKYHHKNIFLEGQMSIGVLQLALRNIFQKLLRIDEN